MPILEWLILFLIFERLEGVNEKTDEFGKKNFAELFLIGFLGTLSTVCSIFKI